MREWGETSEDWFLCWCYHRLNSGARRWLLLLLMFDQIRYRINLIDGRGARESKEVFECVSVHVGVHQGSQSTDNNQMLFSLRGNSQGRGGAGRSSRAAVLGVEANVRAQGSTR